MWDDPVTSPVSARCLVRLNQRNIRSDNWLRQELAHSRRRMEYNIRKLHRETRHMLVGATPSIRSRSYSQPRRDLIADSRSHKGRRDPEFLASHVNEAANRWPRTPRLPELVHGSGQRSSFAPGSLSNSSELTVPYSTPRSLPHAVVWSPPSSRSSPNSFKPATLCPPPRTSPNKGSKVVVLPSPPWSSPNPLPDSSTLTSHNTSRSYSNRSKPGNLPSLSKPPMTRSKLMALPSRPRASTNSLTLASSPMPPWSLPANSNLAALPSIPKFLSNSKTSPKPSALPVLQRLTAEHQTQRRQSHLVTPNWSPRSVLKKPRSEPHTRRLSLKLHPVRKLPIQNCSVIERNSSNHSALETYDVKYKPIIKSQEKKSTSKRAQSIPLILITEASEIIIPTTEQTENEEGERDDSPETSHHSQTETGSRSFPYDHIKRFRSHSEPSSSYFALPLSFPSMVEGQSGAEVTPNQRHSGTEEAESVSVCRRGRSSTVSVPYFAHLKNSPRRDSLLRKYTARPGVSNANRTTQNIQELISETLTERELKTGTERDWQDLKKCRYLRMPSYDEDNVDESTLDLDEIFSHNAD